MSALFLVPVLREGISLRMNQFRPLFTRIWAAVAGLFSLLLSAILVNMGLTMALSAHSG